LLLAGGVIEDVKGLVELIGGTYQVRGLFLAVHGGDVGKLHTAQ